MKDRLLLVAVVLPILGLVALVGRAQFHLESGRPWVLRITGYDPRDLISGHYLRFRYEPRWDDAPGTCGEVPPSRIDGGCCLCLEPIAGSEEPRVRQLACDDPDLPACESWAPGEALAGPQRYFIPEERAAALERALRTRESALRVTVLDDGTLAIDHLVFDGPPWTATR